MKNQLISFIRSFVAALSSLISNPQRLRLVVTAIILCLVVVALFAPSLAIVADNISGGH